MALFNSPGAFASLSSGLLARKGAAKPAMRPQGFGQTGASLEDLGWNDMGFEPPKPTVGAQERDETHDAFGNSFAEQPLRNPVAQLTPSPMPGSPVHGQQAELAARLAEASDAGEEEGEEGAEDANVSPLEPPPSAVAELEAVADEPRFVAEITVVEEPAVVEQVTEPTQAPVISVKPRAATDVAPVLTLAPPVPGVRTSGRAAPGSGPKAAFTLRLDAARHLRLRLACALTGRSAQMLVTDAVDKLLADYPELDTFAGSLPDGGRSRRVKG